MEKKLNYFDDAKKEFLIHEYISYKFPNIKNLDVTILNNKGVLSFEEGSANEKEVIEYLNNMINECGVKKVNTGLNYLTININKNENTDK